MFRLRTSKDSEGVREALRRLLTDDWCAGGKVVGDTFRLRTKPGRRSIPVTIYGRITRERDGVLVSAWPCPHWAIIIGLPVWAWLCLEDHGPVWFVAFGFILGGFLFVHETRKGYDLLREYVA